MNESFLTGLQVGHANLGVKLFLGALQLESPVQKNWILVVGGCQYSPSGLAGTC